MTNENLYEDVTRMKIDEEKLFRLTKYKRRNIKETDHNTIIIEINDEIKKQKRDQQRRWKTYSKQGWEKFKDTTEEHPELDNTWKTNNIQKEWNNWLKITNRILQESFGKVRIQENRRQEMDDETKTLIERKREIRKKVNRAQRMEDKEMLIRERRQIEEQIAEKVEDIEEDKINKISEKLSEKRNNYKTLWKMKKTAQRKQDSAFIIKSEDGKELRKPEEIKNEVSE